MNNADSTVSAEIGAQIPLFAETEVSRPSPTVQPTVEIAAVSEPSRDAQPDMFNIEYFR